MKKKCKVVMLPTEKASPINQLYSKDFLNAGGERVTLLEYSNKDLPRDKLVNDITPQHLYLISDDEIKEGDWVYEAVRNIVFQITKKGEIKYSINDLKKVIASTDDLRLWDDECEMSASYRIPKLSEDFLKSYVEANGEINEVMVEYKECSQYNRGSQTLLEWIPCENCKGEYLSLKLRDDNTVILSSVAKEKIELSKVIELCKSAWEAGDLYGGPIKDEPTCRATVEFEEWCKRNNLL